jgi:C4-dicarboxylate-binding protein DctP
MTTQTQEENIMTRIARSLIRAALGAALILGVPTAFAAEIILSNDTQQKSLKGQTFEVLKQEIEKRVGAKGPVRLHHSGTLFDQKTQIQGLQLGSAHIISPTAGIYSPVAPKIGVLLLPFMLSTPEAIDAALKDPLVRKAFVPDLEAKNITPVAVWMNGPRDFGHKGREPALTPDQWKGKKIRVQSAPIFVKTMEAIGANVIAMSWSEVPSALQQGVIDAAEPTPNAWRAAGIYKVVDHIILNEYVYSFYIVGANKQWWQGLPADVRKGVQEALDAASKWNWENAAKMNADALKTIEASNTKVHRLNDAQKKAWQNAVSPVWKTLGEDVVGSEVMARLKQIGAQHAK